MDDALAIRRLKRGDIGGLEWNDSARSLSTLPESIGIYPVRSLGVFL